ncbi:hypothetical protein EDD18DRAFT_1363283 [Armillaria luteobubalina]|uniref:Uncharacterized protein n=1 Tax=Armillaria luteobubalina TaxID=153913 RepID=A0AA39PBX9_9AGAR|nr:hypothetical protein EDD18DRAFT_1363283 [Armillaria luteobubalina]
MPNVYSQLPLHRHGNPSLQTPPRQPLPHSSQQSPRRNLYPPQPRRQTPAHHPHMSLHRGQGQDQGGPCPSQPHPTHLPFRPSHPNPPSIPFHGIFLMLLRVAMQGDLSLPNHLINAKHQCDSLSSKYGQLAHQSLPNDVPPNRSLFVDPPDGCKDEVDGLSRLAEHVLMMWGEVECLREARDAMQGIYGDIPSTSGGL